MRSDDYGYLATMDEVLSMVIDFADVARHAQDDVVMATYLRLTKSALCCAFRIYGDRLEQNLAEMKQGESVK